jgi:hypothetical protein
MLMFSTQILTDNIRTSTGTLLDFLHATRLWRIILRINPAIHGAKRDTPSAQGLEQIAQSADKNIRRCYLHLQTCRYRLTILPLHYRQEIPASGNPQPISVQFPPVHLICTTKIVQQTGRLGKRRVGLGISNSACNRCEARSRYILEIISAERNSIKSYQYKLNTPRDNEAGLSAEPGRIKEDIKPRERLMLSSNSPRCKIGFKSFITFNVSKRAFDDTMALSARGLNRTSF